MVWHAERESEMIHTSATVLDREWPYRVTSCKDQGPRPGVIRGPMSRVTPEVSEVRYVMEKLHLLRGSSEVAE